LKGGALIPLDTAIVSEGGDVIYLEIVIEARGIGSSRDCQWKGGRGCDIPREWKEGALMPLEAVM
jgi:hypothetical protein